MNNECSRVQSTRPHWLNSKRVLFHARGFALAGLIFFLGVLFRSNLFSVDGYPLGNDFSVFWSASELVLSGHAAEAYDIPSLHEEVHLLNPEVKEGSYGWFYPPTYLLVIAPLALLPYKAAYCLFLGLTLLAYALVVSALSRRRGSLVLLAGFTGLWDNLLAGQNGFLTAALAGAALISLEKAPIRSGLLIGLLSIKPQLLFLFGVALIASKSWKALWAAVLTGMGALILALLVLGMETLDHWLASLTQARMFLQTGGNDYWMRMPTVFASLRLLGLPAALSYAAQGLTALVVSAVVWKIWRPHTSPSLRYAALTTGTLLISPYVHIYDLTWLALPIAWMVKTGLDEGWLRGEREVLFLAYGLPGLMLVMAHLLPFQIGPWVLLALLGMIYRRTCLEALRRSG